MIKDVIIHKTRRPGRDVISQALTAIGKSTRVMGEEWGVKGEG